MLQLSLHGDGVEALFDSVGAAHNAHLVMRADFFLDGSGAAEDAGAGGAAGLRGASPHYRSMRIRSSGPGLPITVIVNPVGEPSAQNSFALCVVSFGVVSEICMPPVKSA